MDDPESVLFGLDEFRVVDVERVAEQVVRVVIETVVSWTGARTAGRRRRGSRIGRGCGSRTCRSGQRVRLCWRKRRVLCRDAVCPRSSFAEATTAIPPRAGWQGDLDITFNDRSRERNAQVLRAEVIARTIGLVDGDARNPVGLGTSGRFYQRRRPDQEIA